MPKHADDDPVIFEYAAGCPMTAYLPECHYGYSPVRTGVTLCGKDTTYVTITFFPEKTTCPACVDEFVYNNLGVEVYEQDPED